MAKARKVKVTGRAQRSTLTPDGREEPDPTPFAPTLKASRARTIRDNVLDIVRSERFRQAMDEAGEETFEEADDFDIPDDPLDPNTPYEEMFEGEYDQLRQARINAAAEERRQKRRGRKPAPPKAENIVEANQKRTPEPTPRSESGSGPGVANSGETPT